MEYVGLEGGEEEEVVVLDDVAPLVVGQGDVLGGREGGREDEGFTHIKRVSDEDEEK